MSEPTKKGLVPVLRFPEFRDVGVWNETTLGSAATFINGRAYKQDELLEQGKYRVLRVGNFFTNNQWYFSDLELEENKYCENGDLLYAWSASFGPRIWKGEKVIYHYHIWKVIENKGVDKTFLFILLDYETEKMKAQSANGLGLLHITKGTIEGWICRIPKIKEQQKIADCLSSIDELVTAQTQKVAALKAHKKGLMQQLFPAEGETVPKLRFPEFRDAGVWELKELGQLATYTKGFAFKSQDYRNEGIRIIRVSDLGADFIKSDNEKIFIASESAEDYERYKLGKGEIIITTVGSKPELVDSAVGRGIFVHYSHEGLLNQNLLKLEVLEEVNSRFLFSNINTTEYQEFIASISRGNANQANIAVKELMKFELKIPGPNEQQKIANCLSSIDDLITAQTQKVEALKTHKKGLTQQLFPTVEEVAG